MNFLRRGLLISLSTAMVAVLLLLLRASPASASGTCAQDYFTAAGNSQTLGCTANDVSITGAANPRDTSGNPLPSCVSGTHFNVLVDFTVQSTASKTRSNVGLYLGTIPVGQAGSSALTGTCDDSILSKPHLANQADSCPAGSTTCLGDQMINGGVGYTELDGNAGDNCGDADTKSTHIVTVELDGVTCPAVGVKAVVLPDCTTWQVPGQTITCFSDPGKGWPFVPSAAIPGTVSKCSCGQVTIPITPINPDYTIKKSASPTSIVEPGGKITYTVLITNSNAASTTINELCDNKFGNIATASTSPPQVACPTITVCPDGSAPVNNSCAKNINCTLPADLTSSGATLTCTFDGTVTGTEPMSVTDTVTATGIPTGHPELSPIIHSASATVTIGEAAAKAGVQKSLDSAQECATARYTVEVDNLSPASTDETETLTALMDNPFGTDLTKLGASTANPKVVGTTCGVASGSFGLGTMASGQPGALQAGPPATAGALPFSIAVGGKYICEFDGEFCSKLGTAGACATGLEAKNTVTANLSLDNDGVCSGGTNNGNLCASNADCPGTPTPGTCILTLSPTASLTVDSCFTVTP